MSFFGGRNLGFDIPRAQVGVSRWRRFRASVDWPLVLVVAAIAAIGLLNLYSATDGTRHASKFDQVRWMLPGTIASWSPPWSTTAPSCAWPDRPGAGGARLIVVDLVGKGLGANAGVDRHSRRQPSELAKPPWSVLARLPRIRRRAELALPGAAPDRADPGVRSHAV
jgi:hypothetical protein